MTQSSFARCIRLVCRSSARRPYTWLAATILTCLPAALAVRGIRVDTDLARLLPERSRAVRSSEELGPLVGDGGYFSVLFEGERAAIEQALVKTAATVAGWPEVKAVEHRRPVEFLTRNRYALLPSATLAEVRDEIYDLQARLNPMIVDLRPSDAEVDPAAKRQADDRRSSLRRLARLSAFHESEDGRIVGMIVRPEAGIRNLDGLRRFFHRLDDEASKTAKAHGVWSGVSGSLRNRVDEYDLIIGDLARAGTLSTVLIILTLAVSFRSVRVLPVVLFPLAVGLLWSYALVPVLVGELNTISAFLAMVLFGMGVDYSIHLVKRFRTELIEHDAEAALVETMTSTGRAVAVSGATTALGMAILMLSGFRGFSDFGIIGGMAISLILVAMLLALPAALIVGHRWHLVGPRRGASPVGSLPRASWAVTVLIAIAALAAAVIAWRGLSFDYDFTDLSPRLADVAAIKERHRSVFSGVSAPAAVYLAPDLATLDRSIAILEQAKKDGGTRSPLGPPQSLRTLVPVAAEWEARLEILEEIQDLVSGRWTERLDDPDERRLVEEVRNFVPPAAPPTSAEVPESMSRPLLARDGSGRFVLAVNTNGRSKDGRTAMAFTEALYGLPLPTTLRGPTGDKPVLAEILWLVTSEAWWICLLTLAGIFLIVFLDFRSVTQTLWVLGPLFSGLALTLGMMVGFGWKLNFFNIVVLPNLIGLGEDHGVHLYHRWRELGRDTRAALAELFEPLTVCSLTMIMGYLGLCFAHHPGLRSIGYLAVLGITCCWATAVFGMTGFLGMLEARAARAAGLTVAARP